jgi:hypothetical protein
MSIDTAVATTFGRSLMDDADATAGRSTLGLGTAATQNTGTSGATIPLLNAGNTWSGAQTITSSVSFGTPLVLIGTNDDANESPNLTLRRNSATPANNDRGGSIVFQANDSTPANQTYAEITLYAQTVTAGLMDAVITFKSRVAGVYGDRFYLKGGFYSSGATGADQGVNTINVSTLYENGTSLQAKYARLAAANTFTATLNDTNASGWQLTTGAASATVPTIVPNRASATTGIGAQASGNISVIITGTETFRFSGSALIGYTDSIPFRLDRAAGNDRRIGIYTAGSLRWAIGANPTAESGSNVGSDLAFGRYDDAGAFLDASFFINRSTGNVLAATSTAYALINSAASSTVPTLIPNRNSTNTGVGAQASGNISMIVAGAEVQRVASSQVTFFQGVAIAPTGAPGSLTVAGVGNAGIEIGRVDGTAGTAHLDFHAGATVVDYDARLICTAGSGSIGGGPIEFFGSAIYTGGNGAGFQLTHTSASATVPTLIPRRGSTNTGFGANASGDISMILAGVEKMRLENTTSTNWSYQRLAVSYAAAQFQNVASSGDGSIYLGAAAGNAASIRFSTGTVVGSLSERWLVGRDATAESGSDAGSLLAVYAYTDAGAFKATALTISRVDSSVNFRGGVFSNGATGGNQGANTLNFTTLYENGTSLASKYQPLDSDLTTIAGLVDPNADRILFWDDSAGAYAYLTLGTNLSITGTTINASGGGSLSDADYGDITVSSGGTVMTIDNDVVTYAKMQNVGANSVLARAAGTSGDVGEVSLAASQLLGRGASGDVAAITLGTNLSMSGTTLNASGGGSGLTHPQVMSRVAIGF